MPTHQNSKFDNTSLSRRELFGALGISLSALLAKPLMAGATPSASQETLDALADAEAQLDLVEKELNEHNARIEELSVAMSATKSEIESVNAEIERISAEIVVKQSEISEVQGQLSERMAQTYKTGSTNILDIILSAATFDDLLTGMYYANSINERDRELIESVKLAKEELAQQQSSLENQKRDLEELQTQQTQQLDEVNAQREEASSMLNSLSDDVKSLIAQRDAEILAAAEAEREQSQGGGATPPPANNVPPAGGGPDYNNASAAQRHVVDVAHVTPSPGAGWCAKWVSNVFSRAGYSYYSGNANDMFARWCTSSDRSQLQVGMIIAVPTYPYSSAGRIYGHVGIYIGDGIVMENVGPIQKTSLDQWISYYGATVTPRWGWIGGVSLR